MVPKGRVARVLPGVELGAFIVAEGAQVPERTAAFPPHEAAVEALQTGDVDRRWRPSASC
jgi:hypothetical protein